MESYLNDVVGDDDDVSVESVDFLQDPPETMTKGRKLALRLMDKKWYNPAAGRDKSDDEDAPSLEKAWAYFEHVTLYRYIYNDDDDDDDVDKHNKDSGCFKGERDLQIAARGEKHKKTKLFPPLSTPHSQLGQFGIGWGLYFTTVRGVGIICFIAGLINLWSMWYFESDEYGGNLRGDLNAISYILTRGSAICTNETWVPCPDCGCDCYLNSTGFERTLKVTDDRCTCFPDATTGEFLEVALQNNCEGAIWPIAAVNLATNFFISISIVILTLHLKHQEVLFDEKQQTAQDYSIKINDPPPDALDPKDWRKYFDEQFDGAQATVVTVVVNNDLLVQALIKRRIILQKIAARFKKGESTRLLHVAKVAAEEERGRTALKRWAVRFGLSSGVTELYVELVAQNARIQALAQLEYKATKVYVSFETEADQRHVLTKLSVGRVPAKKNDVTCVSDPKYLFKGKGGEKYVVHAVEAEEPNTVHWESLSVPGRTILMQRFIGLVITVGAIALSTFIITVIADYAVAATAITITVTNRIFPEIAKVINNSFQEFTNEGAKQKSLYVKLFIFRFVNTVLIISMTSHFTKTLSTDHGLITKVAAIYFAEILTLQIVELCDFGGIFKRHVLAPRMKNQDAMNLKMNGKPIDLAERYTNVSKMFFLALGYSSIYPTGFFLCSFTLFLNYFTDRFSLMRTWKRQRYIGTEISRIARVVAMSLSWLSMALMSSYFYSAYPFDNLCDTGDTVGSSPAYSLYEGNHIIYPAGEDESEPVEISIEKDDGVYKYCNQNFAGRGNWDFPFLPSRQEGREGTWMTSTQEQISTVFAWVSVGVICTVLLWFLFKLGTVFQDSYYGSYDPVGEDKKINFSDVEHISSYIPQVKTNIFAYPLVVCDTKTLERSLFDWVDPEHPHSYYDLTRDALGLLKEDKLSIAHCFDRVKLFRPEGYQSAIKKAPLANLPSPPSKTNVRENVVATSSLIEASLSDD